MPRISVIVPVLNEAGVIGACLRPLQASRSDLEIIVADGGSRDATVSLATPLCDRVLECAPGRALQMNAGAQVAGGGLLLFLHADTIITREALNALLQCAARPRFWGRFDVRLSGRAFAFRVIAFFMNWRSRLSGIATGDQCLFVSRALFHETGGYAPIPLMEDIELSRRLRALQAPLCLRERVEASSRRWEKHGIVRTVWKMWMLRLRYALGARPAALAREYEPR
jgi:rSAM/selenodomain-associated transferase 2